MTEQKCRLTDGHQGPSGRVALKDRRGKVAAPIFLLVPQVKLPSDSVPGLIVASWVDGQP